MADGIRRISEIQPDRPAAPRPTAWLGHSVTLDFATRRMTGNPNFHVHQWFRERYLTTPAELSLSIGCGEGMFERQATVGGYSRKFHGIDRSTAAIERARASAEADGLADRIEYSVAELDDLELPVSSYDVIYALMSARGVLNLENLFAQCRRALKPGGHLFLNDYIGPSRLQTPARVTAMINRLLSELPARYRRNLFADDGSTIDSYRATPLEHLLRHDPYQAVRSADILDVMRQSFDIIEYRAYGGAIMHMLLNGIAGNFDAENEADATLLRLLATFEEMMEGLGVVASDFAAVVAIPKK